MRSMVSPAGAFFRPRNPAADRLVDPEWPVTVSVMVAPRPVSTLPRSAGTAPLSTCWYCVTPYYWFPDLRLPARLQRARLGALRLLLRPQQRDLGLEVVRRLELP